MQVAASVWKMCITVQVYQILEQNFGWRYMEIVYQAVHTKADIYNIITLKMKITVYLHWGQEKKGQNYKTIFSFD